MHARRPLPSPPRAILIAALLALLGALGCEPTLRRGSYASGPATLAPPAHARFLVAEPPRALGPLRPATEGEIKILKKNLPLGAVVEEIFTADSDSMIRI